MSEKKNLHNFKPSTYYRIATDSGDDPCIVYCYEYEEELVLGFNVADGGAMVPVWDVPEKTHVTQLDIHHDNADMVLSSAVANEALRAMILTREYVGGETLPSVDGWEWYDLCNRLVELFPDCEWAKQFTLRKW